MSLRINTIISKIPKILLGLVALFLVGCLIRVIVWEHGYYASKEGSERAPVQNVGMAAPDQEEVDETEITVDEFAAHQVSVDKPRYMYIEKLSTRARIREVGLTGDGAMATLANIFDVAWYRSSDKPGQGGTLLMNGHNGGPTKTGVFKHLGTLEKGDLIVVERGDGALFYYEVYENKNLPIEAANKYMQTMQTSPVPGTESLSVITCTGEWSQAQRTYLSRTMIRAILVNVESF